MRLFRADSGPVEDRSHVDIEQIREGLSVFGVAPWKNGLPEPEYDNGPFYDEDQTDVGMVSMAER